MTVFLVCTILLLTLAVTPLRVTAKVGADVLQNRGYISLWLFFIPIFKSEFHIESPDSLHRNLIIERKKKKDEIHLNADKNDKKSVRNLIKKSPLLSAIRVRNLTVDVRFGKSDNALMTTFTTGAIRTVFYGLAAFLRSREDVTIESAFTPDYNRDVMQADIFAIVSLSLANVMICLLQGLKNVISQSRAHKPAVAKGRG